MNFLKICMGICLLSFSLGASALNKNLAVEAKSSAAWENALGEALPEGVHNLTEDQFQYGEIAEIVEQIQHQQATNFQRYQYSEDGNYVQCTGSVNCSCVAKTYCDNFSGVYVYCIRFGHGCSAERRKLSGRVRCEGYDQFGVWNVLALSCSQFGR